MSKKVDADKGVKYLMDDVMHEFVSFLFLCQTKYRCCLHQNICWLLQINFFHCKQAK